MSVFTRFTSLLTGVLAFLAVAAAPAPAAEILILGKDGRAHTRGEPGVAARGEAVPAPRAAANRGVRPTPRSSARATRKAPKRTVLRELRRLRDEGQIDAYSFQSYRDAFREAKAFTKRLPAGRRKVEMRAVVALLKRSAADGAMTASRLEPLWTILERNREWWAEGPLPASGQRVGFQGSQLVFQYVPGQGLQLHPLANFGKLNALWRRNNNRRLGRLLDELLALPAERAGGLAWEYYFDFGGGRGPWVSGMAQGTGLQAMARAAVKLGRQAEVFPIAARGLGIFETAPPTGVRVEAGGGAHYLLYSFNRGLRVLNGFVQSVVGLADFAGLTADPRAVLLYADGERRLRAEVPTYDTGAWSLYSQAREADLHYHRLVIDFLGSMCERTSDPVYCGTRDTFTRYLGEPPAMRLVTRRLRAKTNGRIRFELSKISDVSVEVRRGGRVVRRVAMRMGYGRRAVAWRVPKRPRTYTVTIAATDLAGNAASTEGTVRVLKPKKKPKRKR